MASPRPNIPVEMEPEDLVFRHRTLISARRILDTKLHSARPPNRDDLYAQRLRRLKTYLTHAIFTLEQQMEAAGLPLQDGAVSQDSPSTCAREPRHLRVIEAPPPAPETERPTDMEKEQERTTE